MIRAAIALVCSGSALASGCAFVSTNAPEPGRSCNTSEATPIADGAFAALFGLAMAASIEEATHEFSSDEAPTLAVLSGLTAGLFVWSAVRGFSNVGKCRRHQRELYEQAVASAQKKQSSPIRHDAWELTRVAAKAARGNDCQTVMALDKVLHGVDEEFRRSVFLRDVAIARCFTTQEVEVPPPNDTVTPPEVAPEPTPAPAPLP